MSMIWSTLSRRRAGRAGAAAARYAAGRSELPCPVLPGGAEGRGGHLYGAAEDTAAHVEKGVDLFFRVDNVYRNRRICVTSSGEELCSFSREHMAPGEMEHIVLPKRLLERAGDGKLTVSLAAERGAKE